MSILKIVKKRLKNCKKVFTYNVVLTTTTENEMSVKANSADEARVEASIQLARMGWTEWKIGKAWKTYD